MAYCRSSSTAGWVAGRQRAQQRAQHGLAGGAGQSQAQSAVESAAQAPRFVQHVVVQGQQLFGPGVQADACRRQAHAAWRTFEQQQFKFFFQRFDVRADGRLAQEQLIGCPCDAAFAGDREKGA
nr:hypothetical protein [Kerstersia gyiorum]